MAILGFKTRNDVIFGYGHIRLLFYSIYNRVVGRRFPTIWIVIADSMLVQKYAGHYPYGLLSKIFVVPVFGRRWNLRIRRSFHSTNTPKSIVPEGITSGQDLVKALHNTREEDADTSYPSRTYTNLIHDHKHLQHLSPVLVFYCDIYHKHVLQL